MLKKSTKQEYHIDHIDFSGGSKGIFFLSSEVDLNVAKTLESVARLLP